MLKIKFLQLLITLILLTPIILKAQSVPMQNFARDTIFHSGRPDSQSYVYVIMGEGFTASEQEIFMKAAREVAEYVVDRYPISLFKERINFYAVKAISDNSTTGLRFNSPWLATTGAEAEQRNLTYFQSTGNGTTLGFSGTGTRRVMELSSHHYPHFNAPLVLVNADPRQHAGVAPGIISAQMALSQFRYATTIHEIGHAIGRLRDESGSSGEGPNESRDGDPKTNRWRAWVGIDGVGLNRNSNGWFAPTNGNTCNMGNSGGMMHPLCRVCSSTLTGVMARQLGEVFLGGDCKGEFANVPFGHTRIVNYAFWGMYSLEEVNIASTVESIGDYAFLACTSLTTITNFAQTPQTLAPTAFHNVNRGKTTLRVPAGSIAAYQAADIWKDFNIVAIPDGTEEPFAGNLIDIARVRVNSWQAGQDPFARDILFDGNFLTFWHARWSNNGSGHRGGESFADIDLGSVQTITQIEIDGRFVGGDADIGAVRLFRHNETGDIFPNAQSMTGEGVYPPINGNVSQSQIDADFAPEGWEEVKNVKSSGLRTRILYLSEPITARYIRLGITQQPLNPDGDIHAQVSEIRVRDNTSSACAHDWTEWEITEEATCEKNGTEERTCKICGQTSSRPIIKEDCETSITNFERSNNRYGIRFAVNPVSESAEISVILPNNERIAEKRAVIYDMTGNVVHSVETRNALSLQWDLRNTAGRFVANGTYLVVVEARDRNGRVYRYSARLGVKR